MTELSSISLSQLQTQKRERLLELHQVKALDIINTLKEKYPNENLFTLQNAFLILLIPLVENEVVKKVLLKHLAHLLDAGIEIGLLPIEEGREEARTLSPDSPKV